MRQRMPAHYYLLGRDAQRWKIFLFRGWICPYNSSIVFYRFIDTVVRVTGYMTGYRVDIPLRILKNYT